MPEALEYIVDTGSRAWREIEDAFGEEMQSRSKAIKRNWDYYNGDHELPLKLQGDNYDDNVIINHVEALADRIVAFLIGDGITFDTGGDGQNDAQDESLRELWEASNGDILQDGLALGGAIEGHPVLRIVPVEGDFPKLVRIKGSHFSAFWDAFDMSRVLWYRLQFTSGMQGRRIDYVRGMLIDDAFAHDAPGWTELTYTLKKASQFTPFGVETGWELQNVLPWPYEWAPIVDWQNSPNVNSYYGKSDVTQAVNLNDALNFVLSNVQRIIKHHAAPKTVGIGFDADEVISSAVGGLFTVNKPRSDVDLFNLEMQSDLQSSMRMAEIITAGLWQSGGMIDPQTMKDKIGAITNFGLRVLFADAIKRTERKQRLYAEAFDRLNKYALELLGQAVPAKIETVWDDPLPVDKATETETLRIDLEHGIISKQTYRELRGYDHETETEQISEEQESVTNPLAGLLTGQGFNTRGFNR